MKSLSAALVCFALATSAHAQLRTAKIKKIPSDFEYAPGTSLFSNMKVDEGTSGKKTQWIVFSDRDNNTTYINPDGKTVFKSIDFMESFYVADRSNGYVKLVKQDPTILKGNRVKLAGKADYYGWVEEDKMLLWSKAFVSTADNHPEKVLTIINDKEVFNSPHQYLKNDSLKIFQSPSLQAKACCKLKLNDIAYVYKFTNDGSFALIGKRDHITVDTTCKKQVLGWVSTKLISPWGQRLFLSANKPDSFSIQDMQAKVNKAVSAGTLTQAVWRYYPSASSSSYVLNSFPVYSQLTTQNDLTEIATAIPSSVFEVTKTRVYNVKGKTLTHEDFLRLQKNIRNYNIVFLIDGGSNMKKHFPVVVNFIQSVRNSMSSNYQSGYNFQYGAVVYRNRGNCVEAKKGIDAINLTPDNRQVAQFIFQHINETTNCGNGSDAEPLYAGMQKALQLFPDNNFQNNIIINIGTTGNSAEAGGPTEKDVLKQLETANARILAFQPYSNYLSLFNNYVLEIKNLIEKSAANLSELKKSWIVNSADVVLYSRFNSVFKDSAAYYLNFPENSMIPGGIVFSTKGASGSFKMFEQFIGRTIGQITTDNTKLMQSLDSAFNTVGIEVANVNAGLATRLDDADAEQPSAWVNNLDYNGHHFFIRGVSSLPAVQESGVLDYSLILSANELMNLQEAVGRLALDKEVTAPIARKLLLREMTNLLSSNANINKKNLRPLSLASALSQLVGLQVKHEILDKYSIGDLQSSSAIPDGEIKQMLVYFNRVNDQLKHKLPSTAKFISGGEDYYVVAKSHFH